MTFRHEFPGLHYTCFFKEKCSLFMTVLPLGYWCVSAVLISLQWSCVFGSLEYRSFLHSKSKSSNKSVQGVLMMARQQRGVVKILLLSKQITCQASLFAGFFSVFHHLLSPKTSFIFLSAISIIHTLQNLWRCPPSWKKVRQ